MTDKLALVAIGTPLQASLLQGRLADEGIDSWIQDTNPGGLMRVRTPPTSANAPTARLHVRRSDHRTAQDILKRAPIDPAEFADDWDPELDEQRWIAPGSGVARRVITVVAVFTVGALVFALLILPLLRSLAQVL